jgi:uncharacterized protein YdhG (YjbR/CyaY superfamily)
MDLNISGVTKPTAAVPAASLRPTAPAAQDKAATPGQDKVTLSEQQAQPLTYADPRSNKVAQSDLAAMLEESDRKAQAIIDLIRPMVEQQGLNLAKVASGEQHLSADPKAIDAAKAAIADGGEFSVQKTAERILSFAKAVIGADPSKLDAVRAAVEKGFQQASDYLGGSLPEISQKTLETIQEQFNRWKNDGIPEGETVTLATPEAKKAVPVVSS